MNLASIAGRFIVVFAATAAPSFADEQAASLSRAPYIQLGTPGSMTVVWRTEGPSDPAVRFGSSPDALDRCADPGAIVVRVSPDHPREDRRPRLHSAPEDTYQYEARLDGLSPGSTYYYAVYDGNRRLAGGDESYRFTTHPRPGEGKPLRFWVVGDSGTGGTDQKRVRDAMLDFTARQGRPIDLYVHVGDMVYPDGKDDQFQARFFDIYGPTLRNAVCWPAMGNHEGHTSKGETGEGPYYDAYVVPTRGEAGGLPSGTEAYYSFDFGRIHFICLDSHDLDRSPAGAMARWLKADLEKTRADWLIAYWHHPPYTKGSHDSDRERQLIEMRTHLMPILEAGGVDVVLTGHSHIYERSMLMDGAYATPTVAEGVILDDGDGDPEGDGPYRKGAGLNPHEGTVQVVAGHGGAGVSRKGTMPVMKRILVEHGSVVVDVAGDTLTAVMINKEGATRDLFRIEKRGQVTPQRIAHPWQPPAYEPDRARPAREVATAAGPPPGTVAVIEPHSPWHYLAGSRPIGKWTRLDYVAETAEGWKVGNAGFGYGDDDDATTLAGMRGNYAAAYIRHVFEIDPDDAIAEVGLVINYDDAFIAYLNGREVLRVGVDEGRSGQARGISGHEARGFEYFPLKGAAGLLLPEDNVLAIEGHNTDLDSSDFSLDPYLVVLKKEAE